MVLPLIAAGLIGGGLGFLGQREAGRSAERAAGTVADAERERMDYLQDRERIPLYYRDRAMQMLANEFGIPGYSGADGNMYGSSGERRINPEYENITGQLSDLMRKSTGPGGASRYGAEIKELNSRLGDTPQYLEGRTVEGEYIPNEGLSLTERATRTPIYNALMARRGAGEEAIMRSGQMGSLGGRAKGIADYNQNLEEDALLTSYNQLLGGLGGFTGYQGFGPEIAQGYSNIGAAKAQGGLAASQGRQDFLSGLGSMAGQIGGAIYNQPQLPSPSPGYTWAGNPNANWSTV